MTDSCDVTALKQLADLTDLFDCVVAPQVEAPLANWALLELCQVLGEREAGERTRSRRSRAR